MTEFGQSKGHINPYLVLECAWRVSNWTAMKEALVQVRPVILSLRSFLYLSKFGSRGAFRERERENVYTPRACAA